jgi:glycosyltransferase involved in cell wall biosynthesis
MKLSLMAMTKNGSWRLERMLRSVGENAFEIVIGIDAATTDDTVERVRRYTSNVFLIDNPQGYIEPHIKALFEKCTGDWVLRLDDDELMSTNFSLEAIPHKVLDEFDLIGFPRPWLVNTNPPFYVGTGRELWELIPQYRLMKRSAHWSFTSQIHTPGFEMKPAYEVPDMFIYHAVLLDQSYEARRRKYDFYQSFRDAPWNRDYLLDPSQLYETEQALPCFPDASSPPVFCYDTKTMLKPVRCHRNMFPPLELLQNEKTHLV